MVTNLFLGSNTPSGFYSFYAQQLEPLECVYILKGGPGTGKSTLIKKLLQIALEKNLSSEVWHCSGDPPSVDGLHVVEKKVAIVDGTQPHSLDAKKVKDRIIFLGDCLDIGLLSKHSEIVDETTKRKKMHFNSAYCQINAAYCNLLAIYSSYKKVLNEAKLIQLASSLSKHIWCAGSIRRQFATALTPDGFVTYKEHLEGRQIIALKAKSMFVVKKFLSILQNMLSGYNAYHCTFEPDLADSIVSGRYAVVVLDDCIVANEVIDLDTALSQEVNEEQFVEEKKMYERSISLAIRHLYDARECHKKIEQFYISAMNFDEVDKITDEISSLFFH